MTLFIAAGESAGRQDSGPLQPILVTSLFIGIWVVLTPEGIGARLAKTFGGEDIQFESEDFNQAWRVRAGVAKFAHDVVHPRVMERLRYDDARGLSLGIEGTDLLCWTAGMPRWEALAGRLQVMHAVVDAIPWYVWLDHGYDPGPGHRGAGDHAPDLNLR